MIITGIDTETYNGYVKLLVLVKYDTDTKTVVLTKSLEENDTLKIIDFLSENCRDSDYNVFYNIAYDISAIIKKFVVNNIITIRNDYYKYLRSLKRFRILEAKDKRTPTEVQEFNDLKKELDEFKPLKYTIGGYMVSIINGKSFSIKKLHSHKKVLYFFDVANFYKTAHDGFMTLDNAAQHFLGEKKNNTELGLDREKIGTVNGYYENNRKEIIKYCEQDSLLTAKLMAHTIESYHNIGINFPKKPYSKASVSKQYLKDNYKDEYKKSQENYNSFDKVIKFKKFYHGGYIRTFAVGVYDNVINRDIRSAYPDEISKLFSLHDSIMVDYHDSQFEYADYKFYEIEIRHVPVLQTKVKNSIFYFDDDIKQHYFITEYDKKVLDLYGYKYDILDACGILTKKQLMFPDFDKLYTEKNNVKHKFGGESAEYMNIKIVMNGFYGVLAQSKPHITQFTNFVYSSYITSSCRYKILKEAFEIGKDQKILQISTDSILFKLQKPEIIYKEGEKLGEFENELYDRVVIYGNGIYTFVKNGKIGERKRGLSGISLEKIANTIDGEILIEHNRPYHISESIIQEIPDLMATFKTDEKVFSPALSLSKSYNAANVNGWLIIDFSLNCADMIPYKYMEVVK